MFRACETFKAEFFVRLQLFKLLEPFYFYFIFFEVFGGKKSCFSVHLPYCFLY